VATFGSPPRRRCRWGHPDGSAPTRTCTWASLVLLLVLLAVPPVAVARRQQKQNQNEADGHGVHVLSGGVEAQEYTQPQAGGLTRNKRSTVVARPPPLPPPPRVVCTSEPSPPGGREKVIHIAYSNISVSSWFESMLSATFLLGPRQNKRASHQQRREVGRQAG